MKKRLLPTLLILSSVQVFSQVTVNQADMPSAGDTLRFSVANTSGIDAGSGGSNQTWDFSNLQSTSQFVDEFLPVASTPFTYVATYGFPFSSSYSDMGRLDNSAFQIPTIPIPGFEISITDVYNFYKSNSGDFSQMGFGASINSFPVPIPYSDADVLVPLPLTSSSTNSSAYSFNIQIPTLGYYGRQAVRNNEVDGWGTLITPFGTFQTLRVRSELVYTDTLAIDQLGFGFQLPEQSEIKYKWLAPGYGWPLLEITATVLPFIGTETITRVVYRDGGIDETGFNDQLQVNDVLLYPNPASDVAIVNTQLKKASTMSYTILDATGRVISQVNRGVQAAGTCMEILPLTQLNLANGMYFIKIQAGTDRPVVRPLHVNNH